MQNALSDESVSLEKNGIKVTVNGNFMITELNLNENLNSKETENIVKDLFNEAVKKIQKIIAQKMQEMGGLGNLNNFG